VMYEHVQRRCVAEGRTNWAGELLTPETVTLYDLNKYVIMPATKAHQCSYVELVTGVGEESARRCPDGHVPMAKCTKTSITTQRRFRTRSTRRSSGSAPPTGRATAAVTGTSCAAHARRHRHP
jgi:hypothetical protein